MRLFHRVREHKNFLFFVMFAAGFVAGILLMNIGKDVMLDGTGFLDEYSLCQMKYMTVESSVFFFYVLKKRLGQAGCLMLLSTTYLGLVTVYAYTGWLGASLGMLLGASVLRYGVKGILLVVTSVFPHYLIYVPAWWMLLKSARELCITVCFPAASPAIYSGEKKAEVRRHIRSFVMVAGVVIIGAMIESYVNPKLVMSLLKIF